MSILPGFRRSPSNIEPAASAGPVVPAGPLPLARFLTLGGAQVVAYPHHYDCRYTGDHLSGYAWRCHGCGREGGWGGVWVSHVRKPGEMPDVLDAANAHAAACRAMPHPNGA